jgi:hypothetical protein
VTARKANPQRGGRKKESLRRVLHNHEMAVTLLFTIGHKPTVAEVWHHAKRIKYTLGRLKGKLNLSERNGKGRTQAAVD